MTYVAFLLVFLGEVAIRALFGIQDIPAAFGHGFLAGLVVLGVDFVSYFIRSFSPRS
ncbi:hypothetical protein ASZ90_000087 [hydrocarbon metagenome]|uniref:Uncharacterized protein n=1 Tax=hydrocarbon metagenome TaxID=938273 RepID=A0A0W8GAB1_9ZZZZ